MAAETIALIRAMAAANRFWGADRIRVSKRTIQRYLRQARPSRPTPSPRASPIRAEVNGC